MRRPTGLTLKRRTLMRQAGVTPAKLRERWSQKFGRISITAVHKIIRGQMRSAAKEIDLAQLLDVAHSEIFPAIENTKRRDLLPSPEEIGPFPEPWETKE